MKTKFLHLFFISILFFSCSEEKEKVKPTLTAMTESVYASVTIQPNDLYAIYAAVPGVIDAIFIEEGDEVIEGQKLAQIINTNPQINTKNAQLSLDLARANYRGQAAILTSIKNEIQAAQLKLTLDSANFFRQKRLWEKNVGSKIDYDTRKLNYDLSKNNLAALQKKYVRTKKELETQIKQSENALKSNQVNVKDYSIESKISGSVYTVFKNAGELVSQQQPLATIGRRNDFVIEMMVDEVDIARIEIGQKTLINLDAYNGQVFEANISKIYPQKEERTQTFKIEATFQKPPKKLYSGLSGEANIILSEKASVMTIPIDFLLNDDKVLTENGEQTIEVGVKNMERVEVVSGIDTSTFIIKPN